MPYIDTYIHIGNASTLNMHNSIRSSAACLEQILDSYINGKTIGRIMTWSTVVSAAVGFGIGVTKTDLDILSEGYSLGESILYAGALPYVCVIAAGSAAGAMAGTVKAINSAKSKFTAPYAASGAVLGGCAFSLIGSGVGVVGATGGISGYIINQLFF